MAVFHTRTAAGTQSLGRSLARTLAAGDVVAFYGELGAGKTTMIKGVCAGLGVEETVKSPSFVIVTEYRGRVPVCHMDFYRVAGPAELEGTGAEGYLGGDGICLVEWAERAEELYPAGTVRVRLFYEGDGRRVEVEGRELEGVLTEPGD